MAAGPGCPLLSELYVRVRICRYYAGCSSVTAHYVCLVGIGDPIPAHIANLGYTGTS